MFPQSPQRDQTKPGSRESLSWRVRRGVFSWLQSGTQPLEEDSSIFPESGAIVFARCQSKGPGPEVWKLNSLVSATLALATSVAEVQKNKDLHKTCIKAFQTIIFTSVADAAF